MRTHILFLLFFTSISPLISQESSKTLDYNWLKNLDVPNDEQMDSLETLFNLSLKTNMDTSLLVANRAIELTEKAQDQSHQGRALVMQGRALITLGKFDEAEAVLLQAAEIGSRVNQLKISGSAYNHLGRLRNKSGEPDNALNYYLKAIAAHQENQDTVGMYNTNFNIAGMYYNLKIWSKTEEYTEKAARLAEDLGPNYMQRIMAAKSAIYNSIGRGFKSKADTISGDKKLLLDSMNYYLNKGIEIDSENVEYYRERNDQRKEASALNNLVNGYISIGDYATALKYGKEAELVCEKVGDNHLLSQSKKNLANAFVMSKQPSRALPYAKVALELAIKQNDKRLEGLSNNLLRSIYSDLGMFQKALKHYEAYNEYLKELNDTENKKVLADAEANFQSSEKQKQILQQEKDILQLQTKNLQFEKQRNIIFGGGIGIVLLSFLGFRLSKTIKERNDKKEFAEALIYAQEEERKRIARDLHDGVGQSLLLIKKQMTKTKEVTKANQKLISETLDEVRAISQDLHPFKLEKFGLTSTIEDSLEKIQNSTDLFVTHEIDTIDNILSESAEINIYRTIQEAMNNIIKHADATAAKVTIKSNAENITILIQDNGKGFDFGSTLANSKNMGLRTMQERISNVGGRFNLKKVDPKGTMIEMVLPL